MPYDPELPLVDGPERVHQFEYPADVLQRRRLRAGASQRRPRPLPGSMRELHAMQYVLTARPLRLVRRRRRERPRDLHGRFHGEAADVLQGAVPKPIDQLHEHIRSDVDQPHVELRQVSARKRMPQPAPQL